MNEMITEREYNNYIRTNGITLDLPKIISRLLDSVGIYYRIWIRVKTYSSVKK